MKKGDAKVTADTKATIASSRSDVEEEEEAGGRALASSLVKPCIALKKRDGEEGKKQR